MNALPIQRIRVPSPSEIESTVDSASPAETHDGTDLSKKDDPITAGPQKAKSAGPDMDVDYDARFNWCLKEIQSCEDGGALETFFNDEVQPDEKAYFPSDFTDLQDAFSKRINFLNANGE